jgi:rhodanese-related sulfurtransferase
MARAAFAILHQAGYRNMVILDEGIPGWHARKYPTESAAAPRGKTG